MKNELANKNYRSAFVEESVKTGIAFQTRALRLRANWSQKELGEKSGKPQNVISRLENPDYGNFTIKTLLDLAAAFDIALSVKFVSFSELLNQLRNVSPEALAVPSAVRVRQTMNKETHGKTTEHEEKLKWMALWAARNGLRLELAGECGFGRECVGVVADGNVYPDYVWHDEDTLERLDSNGDVWTPPGAYHKHPCVAVLGRGEAAESQLFDWLQWFDANGFKLEKGAASMDPQLGVIGVLLGKHRYARMVRISKEKSCS